MARWTTFRSATARPRSIATAWHPRGSQGRLSWTKELGLQATYQPKALKGTTFQVDVLNVFNERGVTTIEEAGEASLGSPSPAYGTPLGIQTARTFRFLAQYEF